VERVVALLCNPSTGSGRAARVLPEVEAALRELDVSFRTEVTRDLVAVDRPFAVSADGDPIGHRPTTIRVIPRAVRVLAPQ